jgi:hypothetical protein
LFVLAHIRDSDVEFFRSWGYIDLLYELDPAHLYSLLPASCPKAGAQKYITHRRGPTNGMCTALQ